MPLGHFVASGHAELRASCCVFSVSGNMSLFITHKMNQHGPATQDPSDFHPSPRTGAGTRGRA